MWHSGAAAILVSQLPLNVMGGGEVYSAKCFDVLIQATTASELWCVASPPGELGNFKSRMEEVYVRMEIQNGKLHATERLKLNELLRRTASFDLIAIHQYLSRFSVFDWIANLAPDQRLVLTSLGHEVISPELTKLFETSPNILVAEISPFAQERSLTSRGVLAYSICAAVGEDFMLPPKPKKFKRRGVAVGRQLPHKGFEITAKAVGKVQGWTLDIAGPKSGDLHYENYLEEVCSRAGARRLGEVTEEVKNQLVADASVLIASSCSQLYDGKCIDQAELFGLVIVEAVALGTIPISSDIASFVDIMKTLELEDWIYEQRNTDQLAALLSKVDSLSDQRYIEIIEAAQRKVREHFLWDDYWHRINRAFGAHEQHFLANNY